MDWTDWEQIADSLVKRVNDLIDRLSTKMNKLDQDKEDTSNKKSHLDSTNGDHYPSIPAVKTGLEQNLLEAKNYTDDVAVGISNSLEDKVDKEAGKGLSDENFTSALKQKLETVESSKFRGTYTSLSNLLSEYPNGQNENWHKNEGGWYADVGPAGEPSERYIWDHNDFEWVAGGVGGITAEQVKDLYESNSDTNAFTNARKTKLSGIETGAEKNVQSDMNETDQTKASYVKNKKTKLSEFQNDSEFTTKDWVKDNYDDDVQKGIDAKEQLDCGIGGRNYISENLILAGHYANEVEIIDGKRVYNLERGTYKLTEEGVFEENTQYVLRYWLEDVDTDRMRIEVHYTDSSVANTVSYRDGTPFLTDKNKTVNHLEFRYSTGFRFIMTNPKFEKGCTPTDWTPAPEDQITDWDEDNPNSYSYFKNKDKVASKAWAEESFAPLDGYPDWAQMLEDLLNF